jgi:Protein of unknown function (DUF1360)
MSLPDWWEGLLLALAAWRVWHLLALDDITDRPRRHVTANREKLLDFIECPYCLGFWIALAWVVFYAVWPVGALWAALPFALNAGLIATAHWLSDR